MARMMLLQAGPTPWDQEDRLVGSRPLPLAPEAVSNIVKLVEELPYPAERVYCCQANEACLQVARMVAQRYDLRLRDEPDLEEVGLGLWEGLTQAELKFRYPSVYPQWLENPLSVIPPDGEPLDQAIDRLNGVLMRLRRRAIRCNVAMTLRPLSMQILLGLLGKETPAIIGQHLHHQSPIETFDWA